MDNQTEDPSANDDIESVMRDILFQHVQSMMRFTKTASLALQIPDTDIEILAGPRERIENYLRPTQHYGATANVVEDVQELFRSSSFDVRPNAGQVAISGSIDAAGMLVDAILEYFTSAEGTDHLASQSQAAQPTDISQRLRERAGGGYTAVRVEDGALMLAAAAEIERYYTGMLAWKQTAEKKDRDWNAERMGRVDDRIAARESQAAPVAKTNFNELTSYLMSLANQMCAEITVQYEDGSQMIVSATSITPTPQEVSQPNPDGVAVEVRAWIDAEKASREAVKAYNEAVHESNKHIWPGTDIDAEFQIMSQAKNKAFHAMHAMYDALLAPTTSTVSATSSTSASAPEGDAK